jgi:hypothetical protein
MTHEIELDKRLLGMAGVPSVVMFKNRKPKIPPTDELYLSVTTRNLLPVRETIDDGFITPGRYVVLVCNPVKNGTVLQNTKAQEISSHFENWEEDLADGFVVKVNSQAQIADGYSDPESGDWIIPVIIPFIVHRPT